MWKTVLFVSFRHRLFLIFLECPLICLVSSSISRFCSSSFSIPFTILYRVIGSPPFCPVELAVPFLLICPHMSASLVLVPFLWLLFGSFLVSLYPILHVVITPLLHILILNVSNWLEFFSYPYPCSGKPP